MNNYTAGLITHLDPKSLNVVGSVGPPGEVREVELDLVPPIVQSHGHGADERFHSGRWLVVGGSESPTDIFVIQNLA